MKYYLYENSLTKSLIKIFRLLGGDSLIVAIGIVIFLYVAANIILGAFAIIQKWPIKEWLAGVFGVNMTVTLVAGIVLFVAKILIDFS